MATTNLNISLYIFQYARLLFIILFAFSCQVYCKHVGTFPVYRCRILPERICIVNPELQFIRMILFRLFHQIFDIERTRNNHRLASCRVRLDSDRAEVEAINIIVSQQFIRIIGQRETVHLVCRVIAYLREQEQIASDISGTRPGGKKATVRPLQQ